ncbi:hypothetical protein BT96DRAFT_1011376 [Gymnopus androsaceus JB14]|uniref:Uncharacterized protein n=1 Tax=Gymnopus androsaceus JB14 TaxID=1447944 RepID=A0A6A4IGT8_9AGAR|nr:hypothetical protein BT96DRAFT_1011376 [Gymnopus androsaceus JB14]
MVNGNTVNVAALVVALVAFVVALLQVIQQYVSSAPARTKVNRAAIGKWSTLNRYRWSFRYWQMQVHYVQPTMKADVMVKCIHRLEDRILNEVIELFPPPHRRQYSFSIASVAGAGAQGERLITPPKVVIQDKDKGKPVELTWRMKATVENAQKRLFAVSQASAHVKASWYNMMADIVVDPLLLKSQFHETELMEELVSIRARGEEKVTPQIRKRIKALMENDKQTYADAEAVASDLDNPALYVHASDLIQCALLLDMDPAEVDIQMSRYDMRGQFCSLASYGVINSANQPMLCYFSKPGHWHQVRSCSRSEASNLLKSAKGTLCIGDSFASVSSWGYNSVEMIFRAASAKANGNGWQEISLKDQMVDVEDDSNEAWNGKWLTPLTPSFPFLMGICGASAVANAFPRRFIDRWPARQRELASRKAYRLVEATTGFFTSPQNLFSKMLEDGRDVAVVEGFKVCNNWGCEYGGLRGWLVTNLAEFTYRISQCWKVQVEYQPNYQVPILSNLKHVLRDGSLNRAWGVNYTQKRAEAHGQKGTNSDRNNLWRMQISTLLFLQIMLFDSWLASHCEMLMNNGESSEYTAPAPLALAEQAKNSDENNTLMTTGWRKCRAEFTVHYLRRLANGRNGRSPSCIGVEEVPDETPVSIDIAVQEERWQDMPIGGARQWMIFDAVFTLRAITMAARLESLKDSSVLLDLRSFDPLVRMM